MTISYDYFSQLDIRIGTILSIEEVPDADKLLKLTVDIGEDTPRQIISGIKQFFADPQVLVGQQVPILANLEPRTIRGLESQGMILAVGDAETFSSLHPKNTVPPGSRVC